MSTREDLLRPDCKVQRVEIGDDTFYVRSVGLLDATEWRRRIAEDQKKDPEIWAWNELKVWLLTRSLCDKSGKRICTPDDTEALGDKSPEFINALFEAALEVSRLVSDAGAQAEKNSETTQTGDSPIS
jgi:hypothetical protein